MRKYMRQKIWWLFCIAGIVLYPGVAQTADSLSARIIWVENNRMYFNVGSEDGITPGWLYRQVSVAGADTVHAGGTIDRVYLDLCSAPASAEISDFTSLPEVCLYPPTHSLPRVPHMRIGFVDGGREFRLPEDILDQPLYASLFYPWTREGDRGGLGTLGDPMVSDSGTHSWTLALDTLRWPGEEFPAGWGKLADRLHDLISQNDDAGCPTIWALRPPEDDIPGEARSYFEGFSQVGDTALSFNYATPFFTFPQYVNSGAWRRAVAVAGSDDPESAIRSPGWYQTGRYSWVCSFTPNDAINIPFFIDTISVIPFIDHDDQWLAFELGHLDAAVVSIDDRLRASAHHPAYRFSSAPQNALVFLGLNQQKSDLSDNDLTRAVCNLIDKESLVRALLADQAVVADAILSEDHLPAGEPFYPHNPTRGRRILKDIRLRRTLNFYVDTRIDRAMTIARHIAGKLGAGRIKIRLIEADREMFADADYRDSMDVCLYLWTLDPDAPDPGLYPFLYPSSGSCGANPLLIDDPGFVEMMEQARREPDPDLRERYYREIEYDLLAGPYICPLFRPTRTIVTSRHFEDIHLTGSGEIDIVTSELNIGARKAVR